MFDKIKVGFISHDILDDVINCLVLNGTVSIVLDSHAQDSCLFNSDVGETTHFIQSHKLCLNLIRLNLEQAKQHVLCVWCGSHCPCHEMNPFAIDNHTIDHLEIMGISEIDIKNFISLFVLSDVCH
jgi:hypothetical protein